MLWQISERSRTPHQRIKCEASNNGSNSLNGCLPSASQVQPEFLRKTRDEWHEKASTCSSSFLFSGKLWPRSWTCLLHCFTKTTHRYASGWRDKDVPRQMGSWVKALGKNSRRGPCLRSSRSGKRRTCSSYSLGGVSVSGGTPSLVHRHVLLIRSQNEAGSMWYSQGAKATEYRHAVIQGVGQEMIWKLGQKIRIQERWKLGKQGSEGKKNRQKVLSSKA